MSNEYAMLIFILADVVIALLLIAVCYRQTFKPLMDFICGLTAAVVIMPVFLTVLLISFIHVLRTNEYTSVFTARPFAGKNGKRVNSYTFTVESSLTGELTKFGKFLRRTRLEKLPVIYDLLFLKRSIVGVKPLSLNDEKFVSGEDYRRFKARPGFFNPLYAFSRTAGQKVTYEDMFFWDAHYAKKCSLLGDLRIIFTALLRKARGEKNDEVFGETGEKSYCEVLLERGEIEPSDYAEAVEETKREEEYSDEEEESEEEEEYSDEAEDEEDW